MQPLCQMGYDFTVERSKLPYMDIILCLLFRGLIVRSVPPAPFRPHCSKLIIFLRRFGSPRLTHLKTRPANTEAFYSSPITLAEQVLTNFLHSLEPRIDFFYSVT